jgi:hypothetical protein
MFKYFRIMVSYAIRNNNYLTTTICCKHILHRNCLLRQVIEGKIKVGTEVTGRRGRRCRKLLDELKEETGY